MGAMPFVVKWVGVVIERVDPVTIIYITVTIVIDAIRVTITWVAPDVLHKIGVGVVDASVNDCDYHAGITLGNRPGLSCTDVSARCPALLSDVFQIPLHGEEGVVSGR